VLPNDAYVRGASAHAFVRALDDRLARVAGVESASVSTAVPLGFSERRAFAPDAHAASGAPESVTVTWTAGAYFTALGIPVIRGRALAPTDDASAPPVVLVSDALARKYWPGEDAVGKRLKWGLATSEAPWMTIVGVAGDVYDGPLGSTPFPHVYVPYAQIADEELDMGPASNSSFGRSLVAAMRSSRDPADLLRAATAEVRAIDPSLPITDVATMEERLAQGVAPQRFAMAVLGGFAAVALLLAAVGLYGVLAIGVTQRTRELGVRLALGASRGAVFRLVVGQGVLLAGAGIAAGLLAAFWATRAMASMLYGVSAHDAAAFVAAPLLLLLAAGLASYLPARRAAGVNPVDALRG
jgi:predicted permease